MANCAECKNGVKVGLIPAIFMVAGNMMGSGVFMLPANLAAFGSIAILGWLTTTLGAVALALAFAGLARIDPAAGGPYAYARSAFGDYMGYQTNLVYWVSTVVGSVCLAVAATGYLSHLVTTLRNPWIAVCVELLFIWLAALANMLGPAIIGRIQSFTTLVALIPVVSVAILGWGSFDADLFSASWNVSGQNPVFAVGGTLNYTLWAFIGVESAAVSAGVIKNPSRNVPIATISGVLLASICYILSSSVIMGMIPNKELVNSAAPFADAMRIILGETAGSAVAICACIACLGSLGGWLLLTGQSAHAASKDGLFLSIFAGANKNGAPSTGLFAISIIMSVCVFVSISPATSEQFGKLASISVILATLPYIYSCIAIKALGFGKLERGSYLVCVSCGLIAASYCLIALAGSNASQVRWALLFVLATIVFYSATITRLRELKAGAGQLGKTCGGQIRWLALAVILGLLSILLWLTVEGSEQLRHFWL